MTTNRASCPSHDVADPIIRAECFHPVGQMHFASSGVHLALFNCTYCGSTLTVELPGHRNDEDWDDLTPVVNVSDLRCRRDNEPVQNRPGFVARAVAR